MKDYLESFTKEICVCGKKHQVVIPQIVVEKNAILKVANFVKQFNSKKVFVLADVNTFGIGLHCCWRTCLGLRTAVATLRLDVGRRCLCGAACFLVVARNAVFCGVCLDNSRHKATFWKIQAKTA